MAIQRAMALPITLAMKRRAAIHHRRAQYKSQPFRKFMVASLGIMIPQQVCN